MMIDIFNSQTWPFREAHTNPIINWYTTFFNELSKTLSN